MLAQDTLDVRLKRRFHLRFRVFKTASAYSERQLFAGSAPAIIFQTETANLRDAGEYFSFTARAVIDDSLLGFSLIGV